MFSKRSLPPPIIPLIIILVVIFLFGQWHLWGAPRTFLEKVLIIPVRQKVYNWQRFLKKDLQGCQLKNEREVAELKMRIASLNEENLNQKRLLSAPVPKNWQFLTAKVTAVEDEILIINQGSEDGLKLGMTAVLGETYLGKVSSVSEKMAKVKLPTFVDEKRVVQIISGTGELPSGKGLLLGKGQGKMRIEQILAAEGVAKGDLVMTSEEGGELLIGEVEEVIPVKGEVFKSASVKRLYNPEELETIFLIRGRI